MTEQQSGIASLHPAAQVAAVIAIGAIVCICAWQFFKTMRET
jgi:hypothetical protein